MMLAKLEGGPFEKIKGLIDKAIASGRHFQSAQTGYIHYCPHQKEDNPRHTIPLYENFLFALALLRSKSIENVNEAKTLISNLLHFQSTTGNFPIYLHEYPQCKDALRGIDILAPLYWITKHFGHVLGADLRKQLDESLNKIIQYSAALHQEYPLPYSMACRFAGGLVAVGKMQKNEQWISLGESLFREYTATNDAWCSTEYLADLIIALQMADIDFFSNEQWKSLREFVVNTWNPNVCAYTGPGVKELQYKREPKANIYDLLMGIFFGTFSHRCDPLDIYQLQGALIQPLEPVLVTPAERYEGNYKGQKWICLNNERRSLILLEKKLPQVSLENSYSPLKILWGTSTFAHTFVCQGCKCSNIEYEVKENGCDLIFTLDKELETQEKEKQREINFYFDFHPDYKIHVDGCTATTFEMGQSVSLELAGNKIALKFELLEGEGHFLGHISHGNRPSQSMHGDDLRFEAYDWNIFLRTIRRANKVKLRVAIRC